MPDDTPTPKRYPPKRIVRIDLPDEWEGFWVRAWVNAPWTIRQRITPQMTEDDLIEVVGQLILEHNLTDFQGEDLPPAGERAFFERAPSDAISVIFREVLAQFGRLSPRSAAS